MEGVLRGGPPRWRDLTTSEITDQILALRSIPSYFNIKRAWVTLGYGNAARKPGEERLCTQINKLWGFHAQVDSIKAKRARGYILDALRTLGFRSPRWEVNSARLNITVMDRHGHPQMGGDRRLQWRNVPGPQSGTTGVGDARDMYDVRIHPMPHPTLNEIDIMRTLEDFAWRKFHRYQGFTARDNDPTHGIWHFRAVHIPEGPNSLWHAVS